MIELLRALHRLLHRRNGELPENAELRSLDDRVTRAEDALKELVRAEAGMYGRSEKQQ